jgi:sec-independent protein translocase protein TatA
MPHVGIWELLVILFIVILIFGAKKLPEIGRGLGEGISNFKKSIKDGSNKDDTSAPPAKEK